MKCQNVVFIMIKMGIYANQKMITCLKWRSDMILRIVVNLFTHFSLFFLIIIIANSFVERGGKVVATAAVVPVVVVIKY